MDANIVIYAFKPENAYILQLLHAEGDDLACSDMVRLEVMGFTRLLPGEKAALQIFFDGITVFPIDGKTVDVAIALRQQKAIGSADAIIAATALVTNQKLWTNNVEDFSWIDGLKWHNPIAQREQAQMRDLS